MSSRCLAFAHGVKRVSHLQALVGWLRRLRKKREGNAGASSATTTAAPPRVRLQRRPFSKSSVCSEGERLCFSTLGGPEFTVRSARSRSKSSVCSAPVTPRTMRKRLSFVAINLVALVQKDRETTEKFGRYAQRQYCEENVDFLKQVLQWKSAGAEFSGAWDIFNQFIMVDSPAQVNISSQTREAVEQVMWSADPDNWLPADQQKVFDVAMDEVSKMMQRGTWHSFVIRGHCDRSSYLSQMWAESAPTSPRAGGSTGGGLCRTPRATTYSQTTEMEIA